MVVYPARTRIDADPTHPARLLDIGGVVSPLVVVEVEAPGGSSFTHYCPELDPNT